MKYLFTTLLITLFLSPSLYSQKTEIWGVVPTKAGNGGTIFKTDENGDNFESVYTFPKNELIGVRQMTLAFNGMIYASDNLNIYEYNPNTQTYKVLYAFSPDSTLIYGTADWKNITLNSDSTIFMVQTFSSPGVNNAIFQYDLKTQTYSKLIEFNDTITRPQQGLLEASNGKFYGTYISSLNSNEAGIYELDPQLNRIRKITLTNSFSSAIGMMELPNGKIVGVNPGGWSSIFELDLVNDTINEIISFNDSSMHSPKELVMASNGKLYTAVRRRTSSGGLNGNLVFGEFDYNNSTFKPLKEINLTNGGATKILVDSVGNVYFNLITTSKGTDLMQYNIQSDSLFIRRRTHLDSLRIPGDSLSSSNDIVHVIIDSIVYGRGRNKIYEYTFEYNLNTETYKYRRWDDAGLDGETPLTGVFQASNGKLYGTTYEGGIHDFGVLYEFDPITGEQQVLFHFSDTTGWSPHPPIEAENGVLIGVFFEKFYTYDFRSRTLNFRDNLSHNSMRITSMRDQLFKADNGLFYGFGYEAGQSTTNTEAIFEYNYALDSITSITTFNRLSVGVTPRGYLTQAADGLLYGVTERGGNHNEHSIFSYDPNSGLLLRRHEFDGNSDQNPRVPLVATPDSFLIGNSFRRSSFNPGGIFKMNIYNNNYTLLKTVDANTPGVNNIGARLGSLIESTNGKYYGISGLQQDNLNPNPVWGVYEFDADSNRFTEKFAIPTDINTFQMRSRSTYPQLTVTSICYSTRDTLNVAQCNQYTLPSGRQTINSAGNYTLNDTISNTCGGDSILTINLTLTKGGTGVEIVAVCDEFTWRNGVRYTMNTDSAILILPNAAANGCDSTVILNLTLLNGDTAVTITDSSIVANEQAATYQWLNCNTGYSVISNETNAEYIPSDSGYFAVEITKNNCVDTSACVLFQTTSIAVASIFNKVKLYPNPAENELFIDLGSLQNSTIRIFSLQGKLLVEKRGALTGLTKLPLNFESGIYLVEIENQRQKKQFKIVKL